MDQGHPKDQSLRLSQLLCAGRETPGDQHQPLHEGDESLLRVQQGRRGAHSRAEAAQGGPVTHVVRHSGGGALR